jgi:ubiquinone/menaquinone biosynthesis C-methylase UbiE
MWKKSVDIYCDYFKFCYPNDRVKNLILLSRIKKGDLLVDLACGNGAVSMEARKIIGPNLDLILVDREEKFLKKARDYFEESAVYINNSFYNLFLEKRKADIIICCSGPIIFNKRMLGVINKNLKPGGLFLFNVQRETYTLCEGKKIFIWDVVDFKRRKKSTNAYKKNLENQLLQSKEFVFSRTHEDLVYFFSIPFFSNKYFGKKHLDQEFKRLLKSKLEPFEWFTNEICFIYQKF